MRAKHKNHRDEIRLAQSIEEYKMIGDDPTAHPSPTEPTRLEIQAERLIGDLEYGCAADFTNYRPAALAIARAYLRTFHAVRTAPTAPEAAEVPGTKKR